MHATALRSMAALLAVTMLGCTTTPAPTRDAVNAEAYAACGVASDASTPQGYADCMSFISGLLLAHPGMLPALRQARQECIGAGVQTQTIEMDQCQVGRARVLYASSGEAGASPWLQVLSALLGGVGRGFRAEAASHRYDPPQPAIAPPIHCTTIDLGSGILKTSCY